MEAPKPKSLGTGTETTKPMKKVGVKLFGHEWAVYPCKLRDEDVFKVPRWVNGERKFKQFPSLAKAKTDAKSLLKERYGKADSKIHLTDDEKRDWQAAMNGLKQAGIRTGLETAIRHYADLVKTVGHSSLLTDLAREYAANRRKAITPVSITDLHTGYLAALKKKELSARYQDTQSSHTGQFVTHVGPVMSDQVTREQIQDFVESKRRVGARAKKNLLDAITAMMKFGKSQRNVPAEWDEGDRVIVPAVKPKKVETFTAEELTKLFAAAPQKFQPILALAAFAGIRSSEIEALEWRHIRLLEPEAEDQLIHLDLDVTEESSKRTIRIHETLRNWVTGPFKLKGKLWTGTHDDFYRMQQEVAKKAGVVWKQNALRHTCISAKVALTKDVPRVAYESGNSVPVIKRHYLDLMSPSVAQAWFAVTQSVVGKYKDELERAAEAAKPTQSGEKNSP